MTVQALVRTVQVACNTSNGQQTITAPLDGNRPKAVLFFLSMGTANGTPATHAVFGIGAATSPSQQWAFSVSARDGIAANTSAGSNPTAYSRAGFDGSLCIYLLGPGRPYSLNIECEAEFVSFGTNTVTINWTNAPSAARLMTVVFFAGDELQAYVDVIQGGSLSQTKDVTAPGFEPDLLIPVTHNSTALSDGGGDGNFYLSLGAVQNEGGGSVQQNTLGWHNDDSGGVSLMTGQVLTDQGAVQIDSGLTGATDWEIAFSDFDSQGFSYTTTVGSATIDFIGYLALKLGSTAVKVSLVDTPTSTGQEAVTWPGFNPQAVIGFGSFFSAADTPTTGAEGGALGAFSIAWNRLYSASIAMENGAATMNTQSLADSNISLPQHDGTAGLVAELTSLDASGYTLNWTTADGTARKFIGIAFEDQVTPNTYTWSGEDELTSHDFYLCTLRPKVVFTGRVAGTPSDPYMDINWSSGATGTAAYSGAPIGEAGLAGNTVWFGSTPGGRERGIIRLRSWTPNGPTDPATGAMSIAESDDVGPSIQANDYITIYQDFRLWPIQPRPVQSGGSVTFYEDYDIAYASQTDTWYPIANPGPPAVRVLTGASVTVDFIGENSKLLAIGSPTWSAFLWTAVGSVEGTSTSQGTTASPVTFTWQQAGQYLVSFKVTDSNGNSHTSYTWVFVIDPADPSAVAITNFDQASDSFDFGQGGGELSVTIRGSASVSQLAEGTLAVLACDPGVDQYDTDYLWPDRSEILFTGWVTNLRVSQNPDDETVSIQAASIDRIASNTKGYPISIRSSASPSEWLDGRLINAARAMSYVVRWRSTLAAVAPIIFPDHLPYIARQDFGDSSIRAQLQTELLDDMWIKLGVNHQGVIYAQIEYNWMSTSERTAAGAGGTLHKGVWVNQAQIVERAEYAETLAKVKTGGVYFPGGGDLDAVETKFSESPGNLAGNFGGETGRQTYIILDQDELNVRTGMMRARGNQRWHNVQLSFLNDGRFTIMPQVVFPANFEADDNNRGLDWQPELVCQRVRRTYNNQDGTYQVEVEFEPSVTGPPGETVTLPDEPAKDEFTPAVNQTPEDLALVSWSPEVGTFFFALGGATWDNRNADVGAGYVPDSFGGGDPWWWTATKANGFDPTLVIWFKASTAINRTANAGITSYSDITPGTGTLSGMEFIGYHPDAFTNQQHFFLGRADTSGSGTWASRMFKTSDDGTTWTPVEIT